MGEYDRHVLEHAVYCILQLDAQSVSDIYSAHGNTLHLQRGMHLIRQQLGGSTGSHDIELTRCLTVLLRLESLLMKNQQALLSLKRGIETAMSQAQYFEHTHDTVLSSLADLYRNIISPLGSKIVISGAQRFLADEDNAVKIRVFLLAALRSLVLWRQCGGSKLNLIFRRNHYIRSASNYLKHM